MKKLLQQFTPTQVYKFTWKVIDIDNVVNWVLGISLILVPDFFNRIFFGHEVLSHWIYIVIGIGFLWFAVWQVDSFIKPRKFDVPKLRFAALWAWLPTLVLTLVLLSGLRTRMLLISLILLWIVDLYMLLLGGLYWWVAEQIKEA